MVLPRKWGTQVVNSKTIVRNGIENFFQVWVEVLEGFWTLGRTGRGLELWESQNPCYLHQKGGFLSLERIYLYKGDLTMESVFSWQFICFPKVSRVCVVFEGMLLCNFGLVEKPFQGWVYRKSTLFQRSLYCLSHMLCNFEMGVWITHVLFWWFGILWSKWSKTRFPLLQGFKGVKEGNLFSIACQDLRDIWIV